MNRLLTHKRIVIDAMMAVHKQATTTVKQNEGHAAREKYIIQQLEAQYADEPFYQSMRAAMVPYNDGFYKRLAVQSVLHHDLEKLWQEQAEKRKKREEERMRLRQEQQENELAASTPDDEALYSTDELSTPLGQDLGAGVASLHTAQPLFGPPFSDFDNDANPNTEGNGFISRLKKKFDNSPLLQQAAKGAQNFGTELGRGILDDAKTTARSAVSRAANAAVDKGVSQLAR